MKTVFNEENILKVYSMSSELDKCEGRTWYKQANLQCAHIADTLQLPMYKVTGVLAALSPMNRWSNNLLDCYNVCYAYKQGMNIDKIRVRTFGQNKYKAGMILDYGTTNAKVLQFLAGRKITSFYDNILNCQHSKRITIDGHAYNIACGTRSALAKVKGLTDLTYAKIELIYMNAAEQVNESPINLQAITWITYRRNLNGQLSLFN